MPAHYLKKFHAAYASKEDLDKAIQAAGRMLHSYPAGYPTRAREDVDPREVVEVGVIDAKTYRIDISARPADLSWWIDSEDLVDLGLIQKTG